MKYKWERIGDGDSKIRYVCLLGPHILEVKECGWESKTGLMVSFNAYQWDFELKLYTRIDTKISTQPYDKPINFGILEDWYACNVLFENYLGRE